MQFKGVDCSCMTVHRHRSLMGQADPRFLQSEADQLSFCVMESNNGIFSSATVEQTIDPAAAFMLLRACTVMEEAVVTSASSASPSSASNSIHPVLTSLELTYLKYGMAVDTAG